MSHLLVDLEPLQTDSDSVSLPLQSMTRRRYLAFCSANPELRIEREASGEITIMAPAHSRTGLQNAEISGQLFVWAKADGHGRAFDSSAGFDLPSGANRAPDASWVLKSRLAALSEDQKQDFLSLSPDFVIELRSKSDRLSTLKLKMREYVDNGTRLGWLIDPMDRTVYVYRPNKIEVTLVNPASLSGEPELAGFMLDLTAVWDPGI